MIVHRDEKMSSWLQKLCCQAFQPAREKQKSRAEALLRP